MALKDNKPDIFQKNYYYPNQLAGFLHWKNLGMLGRWKNIQEYAEFATCCLFPDSLVQRLVYSEQKSDVLHLQERGSDVFAGRQ